MIERYELIKDLFTVVTPIIGIILILRQLGLTRELHFTDHIRNKKQSTLEAYNVIREPLRSVNRRFKESIAAKGYVPITNAQLLKISKDAKIQQDAHEILSYLNRFATGTKQGIYDFDVLYSLFGVYVIEVHSRMQPYIESLQRKDAAIFSELQEFINKFMKLYESEQKNSNLSNS